MIDGTYKTSMNTPMGKQGGTFIIKSDGDACSCTAINSNKVSELTGGKIVGNSFEIEGDIKLLLGSVHCKVTGTVDGDKIAGFNESRYGKIAYEGSRSQD